MKWIAEVKQDLHRTVHGIGGFEGDNLVMIEKLPTPKNVEIIEDEDGVYLYYLDGNGEFLTDTWHKSVGDAMEQAEFEFGIHVDDWESVDDNH